MFKKAKHWILILLVCVLFVGLMPGKALAADLTVETAIQAVLPSTAPQVPDIDNASYPYILMEYTGSQYRICAWSEIAYTTRTYLGVRSYYVGGNSGLFYYWNTSGSSGNEWTYVDKNEIVHLGYFNSAGNYVEDIDFDIVFSNFTIYHYTGVVAHLDDMAVAPDVPTFRVNLPSNYVYQYKLNDIPAQLYVDAYVSASGQTLLYTWQKEVNGEWITVDYGEPHGKYYTPPTTVEGTYRYRCKVSNTVGGYTSVAYSNAVYVLVGTSATVPDDGGDLSAKDQLIIDQMGQIKDELGNVSDSVDELPDKITDGMEAVLENEKETATNEGNSFVDEMIDLIPDPGSDGQSALAGLVSACSYNGRDAVLQIPALVMPGIDGMFDETVLLAAQEVDLSVAFGMCPEGLLTIVQVLTCIALVLFLIKDVYAQIEYFATLRGGN